jgi:hypothetical protein
MDKRYDCVQQQSNVRSNTSTREPVSTCVMHVCVRLEEISDNHTHPDSIHSANFSYHRYSEHMAVATSTTRVFVQIGSEAAHVATWEEVCQQTCRTT